MLPHSISSKSATTAMLNPVIADTFSDTCGSRRAELPRKV
jgi:hypothetical protein